MENCKPFNDIHFVSSELGFWDGKKFQEKIAFAKHYQSASECLLEAKRLTEDLGMPCLACYTLTA
jgi:ribosome-binding ATPase YchF (GTP1/OBG family)